MPKDLAELLVPWLLSGGEEQLEVHVSICAEAISSTPADHSDWNSIVCCVLQSSRDGTVWSPISCPNEGAIVNALVTQFRDFVSAVRQFAIKWRLRASSGCCCIGGGNTHIQGGATSWDSSGGENISWPGLRCCEPPGFRGDAWVRQFQSAPRRERMCSVLVRCCKFSTFQLCVQEGATQCRHSSNPVHALFPSLFCTLVM